MQVAVGRGAKARVSSAHARFGVGDAQSLPLQTASVDAAVAGLAMNFVPEPASAVSEMARVVRPGGVVAVRPSSARPRESALRRTPALVVINRCSRSRLAATSVFVSADCVGPNGPNTWPTPSAGHDDVLDDAGP